MKRYFFDYISEYRTLYDFTGRDFQTQGEACEHARLLVIHLQHDTSDYAG